MPRNEDLTWSDEIVQKTWRPIAIIVGTGLPISYFFYTRVIGKRFPTSGHIPPEAFTKQQVIRGRVVSVGDSDNFRLYHTPGLGWGWARKVPTKRKELAKQTIPIRLAGIDAPEGAHFGMPAQPLSNESKEFLTSMVLGRNVQVQLLSRDQYQRVVWKWDIDKQVAMAYVRHPPFYRLKNVSVEMLKVGMATIYTAGGKQYGNDFEKLKMGEARAKLLKKGVWGLKSFVSPGDHKAKYLNKM